MKKATLPEIQKHLLLLEETPPAEAELRQPPGPHPALPRQQRTLAGEGSDSLPLLVIFQRGKA